MVYKKGILKFTKRFFIFIFLMAGIIAGSILMHEYGPPQRLYTDTDWENETPLNLAGFNKTYYNVRLDQHSHTLYSDGSLTVRQNIEWHIAMGFNAIVITDHDTLANKAEIDSLKAEYAAEGVIIIQGMEWTTDRIHCNLIGISEWTTPTPDNPTDAEIQAMITAVHAQGGVVTVNHYPWSLNEAGMTDHPTRAEVLAWGADFIEIVNSDSRPENSYDNESNTFCNDNAGIGKITGTDMHRPDDLAAGGVNGWTLINVTSITEANIMAKLVAHDTEIFYSNTTTYDDPVEHPLNPLYQMVRPIMEVGGLFRNLWLGNGLDWIGVIVYLCYIFVIFAVIEVYRWGKPKLKDRKNLGEETPIASE